MSKTVWYIAKYVSTPSSLKAPRNFCLVRGLSEQGITSVIITSDSNHMAKPPLMNSPSKLEEIEGVTVIWLRTLKYIKTNSYRRILSWLDFEWQLLKYSKKSLPKPDVIICSSLSILTILNGLILKLKYKCKLVFEVRDIWPLTLVEEGGYKTLNPLVILLGLIEKIGYKYSDFIVGTMPNLKEHVDGVLGYSKQVDCVPMGYDRYHLDTDKIEELPADYIKQHIPKDKFIVAHVGSMGITNSLETLLECAVSMAKFESIHFLIVGDGDLRDYYIGKYGNLSNVSFGSKVPKAMVQSILYESDVVYFSAPKSRVWQYGQSLNKVVDYMLSGKPIVASYDGYRSMINEANSGVFIEAENPIILKDTLLSFSNKTSEELKEIGSRGREWLLKNRSYKDLAIAYANLLFPKNHD